MSEQPLIDPSEAGGDAPADTSDSAGDAGGADPQAQNAATPPDEQSDAGTPLIGPDAQQVRPRLVPGSDQTDGEAPATPQDQAELDQVVKKALYFIHGKKSRDEVLKQLHDPSMSVAEAVGRTAFNILMTVSDQKNAVTKEPVDEQVLKEAAGYVIPELMTVGCVAGIFPFDAPPDGGAGQEEVGKGKTEFDRQCGLALLEATKIYGEKVLRGDQGAQRSQDAQDQWAHGVQQEVHGGQADPQFMAAINQMRGGSAPDPGSDAPSAPAPAPAADEGEA